MTKVFPSLLMEFNPSAWNTSDIREKTNCYGYGLNLPGVSVNPGCLNEPDHLPNLTRGFQDLSEAESLKRLLIKDGLISVSSEKMNPKESHIIVAFGTTYYGSPIIRDNLTGEVFLSQFNASYYYSFHVYRMDNDETFSDKYSSLPVGKNPQKPILRLKDLRDHYQATLEALRFERITITDAGLFELPKEGVPISRHYTNRHIR